MDECLRSFKRTVKLVVDLSSFLKCFDWQDSFVCLFICLFIYLFVCLFVICLLPLPSISEQKGIVSVGVRLSRCVCPPY